MIVDPKLFCKGFEDAFGLYVYNLVIASENMQDVRFILFFTLYMFWFFPIEHIFLVSGPSSNLLPCMFCNWRSQWALWYFTLFNGLHVLMFEFQITFCFS